MVAAVRAQPPEPGKPHNAMLVEEQRFSDSETASSTGAVNSSVSSASSAPRCSSLSRLSFDCSPSAALSPPAAVAAAAPSSPPSPQPVAPVRPHRSGDAAWAAIRAAAAAASQRPLGPRDFTLIRRIGGGDIGTVYLCRLRTDPSSCLFAMKVVDRRVLAKKNKLSRAAAERRILRSLDHPFLPTLYADFDAGPDHSCAVTEFCPGGDLHALRHRAMPGRRFPLDAARFYAAEVLLALEYLHMMGVVYRDLKPENVLVRADGHVMLTDFDLSLESASSPSLVLEDDEPGTNMSCFPDHLLLRFKRRRGRTHVHQTSNKCVVAEPTGARSRSFVGTHEYVAPEVARGGPHGAAVDWWALGVFLYELLYGRTPFAGRGNEATLRNVVRAPLAFPRPCAGGPGEAAARDLVARLLDKDPAARLGARRGAADVKAHPFFGGVNFALLRSARPPFVPTGSEGAAPGVRRSQSCKAAAPAATKTTVKRSTSNKDARFDLFF